MSADQFRPPELPEEISKIIAGKPDLELAPTQLSMYRTRMSTYRTHVSNLRSHLSNERTHLSYLRTAVALIGFGITLNKFAKFLMQDSDADRALPLLEAGFVGSGMAALGLLLLGWSVYRFWVVSKDIESGRFVPRYRVVFVASFLLLLVGGSSALWLLIGF